MTNHTDKISPILAQKLEAYDEFLSATVLLQKAFESDEMKAVENFVKRRDELIKYIGELDCQINRDKHSVPFDQSTAVIRQMAKMSEELTEKLKQIISVDRNCNAIAASRCDVARKDLMVIHQKKEGIKGYGLKTRRIPKFIEIQT